MKTIESGIVLCQLWAERKRKLLVICPAPLQKQWANELDENFNLPTHILENNPNKKNVYSNPFHVNEDKIMVCSHHFTSKHKKEIKPIDFSMVVIDVSQKLSKYRKDSMRLEKALKLLVEHKYLIITTIHATYQQKSTIIYRLSSCFRRMVDKI